MIVPRWAALERILQFAEENLNRHYMKINFVIACILYWINRNFAIASLLLAYAVNFAAALAYK
jgi:hypothetical protein